MKSHKIYSLIAGFACFLTLSILGTRITATVATAAPAQNQAVTYNTTTLAGKVASVNERSGSQPQSRCPDYAHVCALERT
jgi:hypothetical protein